MLCSPNCRLKTRTKLAQCWPGAAQSHSPGFRKQARRACGRKDNHQSWTAAAHNIYVCVYDCTETDAYFHVTANQRQLSSKDVIKTEVVVCSVVWSCFRDTYCTRNTLHYAHHNYRVRPWVGICLGVWAGTYFVRGFGLRSVFILRCDKWDHMHYI